MATPSKLPTDLSVENYKNVKEESYSYAVLPWGATEPHNYHLPYLTDVYLSHDISVNAVNKAWKEYNVKGIVLPAIPFGSQNPGQRELPFCIHARYETQKMILNDIVESLHYQGLRILVIVNGHGGNSFKSMIRDLNIDYPEMVIASCDWFSIIPRNICFSQNIDDHAGEQETSAMLYFRPELTDVSIAGDGKYTPFNIESLNEKTAWIPRNWSKATADTGIGNPHNATAEKGREYIHLVTNKMAKLFHELINESPYK